MHRNRKKLMQIPISEFDGLSEYLKSSRIFEITRLTESTDEAFIERAQESIFHQFMLKPRYHSHESSDVLSRLRKQGYTSRQVAVAIAYAVLEGSDVITLERQSVLTRYSRTPYIVVYSTILSLVTLLCLLYLGQRISPRTTIGLLQFEPILAFFGVLFGLAYYWLLKFLVRIKS